MNKLIKPIAYVAIIFGLFSSPSFAQSFMKATLNCPTIGAKGDEKVTNYGTYLAGTGLQRMNSGTPTKSFFQGPLLPGDTIPEDLKNGDYHNNGILYNPANGAVTCKYSSSIAGNSPFSISYMMINALGGIVTGSSNNEIHIKFVVGLNK